MKGRSYRLKADLSRVEQLACSYPHHGKLIASGFMLGASSGIWRTQRDGFTARFVYRKRQNGEVTVTWVIKGIAAV
ncbi:MAG: hypothetical protein GC202_14155 [Alphaproteobacteria bacterium]|nr:hypothetical protein [Alphaproteobacteria bacterium]